jgi:carbamate kinase
MVSLVRVDADDPAFACPDKPVGWAERKLVASPHPLELIDVAAVRALLDAGHVVIAGGGGGVPVVRRGDGTLVGVEAVIDKDRTAALFGRVLGARELIDLTAVDFVYRGFGRPDAVALPRLSVAQARALAAMGEFPAGSMGPKIAAALDFLVTGERVLITSPTRLADALAGHCGTWVTR